MRNESILENKFSFPLRVTLNWRCYIGWVVKCFGLKVKMSSSHDFTSRRPHLDDWKSNKDLSASSLTVGFSSLLSSTTQKGLYGFGKYLQKWCVWWVLVLCRNCCCIWLYRVSGVWKDVTHGRNKLRLRPALPLKCDITRKKENFSEWFICFELKKHKFTLTLLSERADIFSPTHVSEEGLASK